MMSHFEFVIVKRIRKITNNRSTKYTVIFTTNINIEYYILALRALADWLSQRKTTVISNEGRAQDTEIVKNRMPNAAGHILVS